MNKVEIYHVEPEFADALVESAQSPIIAGDVMLAQKIALETDERGALAVANKFAPR